ncbi:hypothetical protein BH23ACT10_BH23ACT10_36060 [soil metagenome]
MIDGINRVILTLLAVVLVAAGVLALVISAGVVTIAQPAALLARLATVASGEPGLWWPVLIGGAVIVALLAAWWAVHQAIVRRPGGSLSTVVLDAGDRGRTTVEAAKVANAAAVDLRRLPNVTASSARLVGNGHGRLLRAHIDVAAEADLRAVREATDAVYDRVGRLLGDDNLPTHTRIRPVATTPRSRVR